MKRRPAPRRAREPQQERSRASLARVMEVTRELLATRSFDAVPLAEILRRSGHSVGRFYSRFPSKEALFERMCRDLAEDERARALQHVATWAGLAPEQKARRLVELVARLSCADRERNRSLLLRLWRDPGRHAEVARRLRDPAWETQIMIALLGPKAAARPGRARRRLEHLIEIVSDTCRHQFLFGRLAQAQPSDRPAVAFLDVLVGIVADALPARTGVLGAPSRKGRGR